MATLTKRGSKLLQSIDKALAANRVEETASIAIILPANWPKEERESFTEYMRENRPNVVIETFRDTTKS